jgi:hypothetical protein
MKECLPSNSSWTLVQGWSGSGNIGMNGILAGGYTYKIILTGGSGGGDCGSNPSQGAAGGQNTYYVTVPDTVQYSYGIGQGGCDGNKGGRDCGGGGSSYITINGTLYAANGGACGGRTRYAGGTNGRPSYTCDGNVSSGYPMSSGAANTASQNGCDNHGYNGNIAIYRLIG